MNRTTNRAFCYLCLPLGPSGPGIQLREWVRAGRDDVCSGFSPGIHPPQKDAQ
ncbi:hypothetical protein HETIRDRAFT_309374 [Heterobasidion irregulare TC 32-1]|uniref:Uncharacterized protein n=1 Tax=Heterobasidion irregulare (strain TC 32-1) TaxID=747525 RepID=W4KIX1_HETIT|nr:uncharacterized protein HETIRDRAFT_309374 [Heterobasidion irregulare TC 32-1]ETW85270.1 hypothetical protein HETIRDRAFT_309374 [Heterobasidion irregulare TC 32-1]